jgi:hypothetical protein
VPFFWGASQAEIKPVEPEAGNAAVGKKNSTYLLVHVVIFTARVIYLILTIVV